MPHVVPSSTAAPALHTGAPLPQAIVPDAWHGVVQAIPLLQATQLPEPLQTPVGQVTPPPVFPVPSMQVGPIEQSITPALHLLGLAVHPEPGTHPTHVPVSQTRFVPHVAPSALLVKGGLQTNVPVEQLLIPV